LRKAERKNRDEFRKLMDEHTASGILTAKTHWRDYHSQVNCPLLWLLIYLFSVFCFKVQRLNLPISFIMLLPYFNFLICFVLDTWIKYFTLTATMMFFVVL
jgi:hypothetical protein